MPLTKVEVKYIYMYKLVNCTVTRMWYITYYIYELYNTYCTCTCSYGETSCKAQQCYGGNYSKWQIALFLTDHQCLVMHTSFHLLSEYMYMIFSGGGGGGGGGRKEN